MRGLLTSLLDRPLGGLALWLCIGVLGLWAYERMGVGLYSSRTYPVLTVTTTIGDTGPQEVETLLSRPVEEALKQVAGRRRVYTVSRPGKSQVTLELRRDADISMAARQARAALRALAPSLPLDARKPVISQYNPAQRPVAVLGISGEDPARAGRWAKDVLRPALNRLDQVADVVVSGAPQPYVLVECDPMRLASLGLTPDKVALALRRGQESLSGGDVSRRSGKLAVRTSGRVRSTGQIADLPVAVGAGDRVIRLGEVASVKEVHQAPEEIITLNGRQVVSLAVYQSWRADLSGLWKSIQRVIEKSAGQDGFKVEVVFSQARSLNKALDRLGSVAGLAALAAALVLLLFLRSIRATLAAMCAIPFSLLAACLLMHLMGRSLDLLSLSGLALAMGILVDNAVVVLEAVNRQWRAGRSKAAGVKAGVGEVSWPITFSTLTTVAAFLPLMLVSSSIARNLGGFFWGLSLSLLASLAAALVFIPILLILLPGGAAPKGRASGWKPYKALLSLTVKRPWIPLFGGAVFLAASVYFCGMPSFGGDGGLGSRGFVIAMAARPGTPIEAVQAKVEHISGVMKGLPNIERVHTRAWANQGRVTVNLKPGAPAGPGLLERVRGLLPQDRMTQFHLLPLGGGAGSGSTLTLALFGPDMATLVEVQKKIRARLKGMSGLRDLVLKMGSPMPQMDLILNHRLIARYGLNTRQAAEQIRSHLTGPVAFKLIRDDREVDVRVRSARSSLANLEEMRSLMIAGADGGLVPLTELVEPKMRRFPGELFRQDFKRVARLMLVLDHEDAPLADRITRQRLKGLNLPPGYHWELGDEASEALNLRNEMLLAAGLALILVYLIMVAASESLFGPMMVMTTAPFAVAGVLLGLRAAGVALGMPVYLGLIILAGMLVNAGLVMIDAMQKLRRRGYSPKEAAGLGAARRLRPVLMTTCSTVAAGLPLFLDTGAGSDAWSPLALTLSSGLLISALFTLVLTPCLFPLATRLDRFLGVRGGQAENGEKQGADAASSATVDIG